MNTELYEKFENKEWKQDDGFIATREFIRGKNISLIEKHRQNIKKVMKNKKFNSRIMTMLKILEFQTRIIKNIKKH